MIKKITINKEKCIHCGLCIKDCIVGILEFDENKHPKYCQNGENSCVACQHCMAICPTGALAFGDKNPDDSIDVGYSDSEELLRLIKSRRSIRQYKNESVPKDKLDKIVKMLVYPPTGGNRDNLHYSIVETKEKMDEIRKLTYDKILAAQSSNPHFEIAKQAYLSGNDIIYRGATSMVAVAIDKSRTIAGCETADPIIGLSYLDLYAQSLGLGTVWCDFALTIARQIPEVYAMLEIPENYTLDYILMLGIPNIRYKRTTQPDRFSITLLK